MATHRPLRFEEERDDIDSRIAWIKKHPHPIVLVLDQLQNPRNIGAILRLAEAARVKKVYLFREGLDREDKKFQRAARSSTNYLDLIHVDQLEELESILAPYEVVALEKTNHSSIYTELQLDSKKDLALIIGNERMGISPSVLQLCPRAVHIPMFGINTSLNVVTATAIVLYTCLQQKVNF